MSTKHSTRDDTREKLQAASIPPAARPNYPLLGVFPLVAKKGILQASLDCWAELGDVFRLPLGKRQLIVFAHPEHAQAILKKRRKNYVKGSAYRNFRMLAGDGLLTREGTRWLKRRRLMQPTFQAKNIHILAPIMTRLSRQMVQTWRRRFGERATVDIYPEMVLLTQQIVGEALFGLDISDRSHVATRALDDALACFSQRGNAAAQIPLVIPTPGNLKLRRALRVLDQTVYEIIAQARQNDASAQTLLGMLMAIRDDETGQPLSDKDLRDETITLFLAGHETTALTLTWALFVLAQHPAVVQRLRDEVSEVLAGRPPTIEDCERLVYTRMVIDEVLRLYPAVWTVARNTVDDDLLGNYRIEAGSIVLPSAYLTHRHPAFWQEPERFSPERFSPGSKRHEFAYYPFSQGPRICIGNTFSLIESQIILATVVQNCSFQLEPGCRVYPKTQVTLRPSGPVRVQLQLNLQ